MDEEKCPACGAAIDLGELDMNNSSEDGYGDMVVYHDYPNCGTALKSHFDEQNGYSYSYTEKD